MSMLKTRIEVIGWLDKYKGKIDNYTINEDLSVDVVGNSFYCHNNKLTSLVGCPVKVVGFHCYNNNLLQNLVGGPRIVGDSFSCYDNKNYYQH